MTTDRRSAICSFGLALFSCRSDSTAACRCWKDMVCLPDIWSDAFRAVEIEALLDWVRRDTLLSDPLLIQHWPFVPDLAEILETPPSSSPCKMEDLIQRSRNHTSKTPNHDFPDKMFGDCPTPLFHARPMRSSTTTRHVKLNSDCNQRHSANE